MREDGWGCKRTTEYCRCGLQMIRTVERNDFADRDTGEFLREAWHSCPKYFPSKWEQLISFGTAGMGHESHNEDNSILGRRWQ